ncbi:protein NIM1-INTERACTING 2-like [Juglans microcarpa x Juglans regia]|uniref:protein NIM1-INTERACTING 2-like n=1 Tax=Juglans microcarpa x Juglans regia TaxID=2249226 RepID=UPI001B7D97F2|nr:protein NIM1-INTERACTING 2-like [Juglans microcarpa x Juglans regia]
MAGSKKTGIEERRKPEDGVVSGRRKRARENPSTGYDVVSGRQKDAGEDAVTEEEVEEFFAILRQIHVAIRYFESTGKGNGRLKLMAIDLEGEGHEVVNGVQGEEQRKRKEEGIKENAGFDLNLDPVPECDPI